MPLTRQEMNALMGILPRMAAEDWTDEEDDDPNYALQGSQSSGAVHNLYPQVAMPRLGLLKAKRMHATPGLASVMINTYITGHSSTEAGTINAKLIAHVAWQNQLAGGNAIVDVTRGALFTVSGSTSVDIDVQVVPTDSNAIFAGGIGIPYYIRSCEATVNWVGSINPVKAYNTSDTIRLTAGVASALIPIPQFAESVMVVSDDPAQLPNLTLSFVNGNIGTPATRYATINPNANGTPIGAGAEYVQLTSTANQNVILFFSLWL